MPEMSVFAEVCRPKWERFFDTSVHDILGAGGLVVDTAYDADRVEDVHALTFADAEVDVLFCLAVLISRRLGQSLFHTSGYYVLVEK